MTGFRPVIHAREGLMLGIRNPLDGPVFDRLEDAIDYCIGVMANHFDRRLGLSDARKHHTLANPQVVIFFGSCTNG